MQDCQAVLKEFWAARFPRQYRGPGRPDGVCSESPARSTQALPSPSRQKLQTGCPRSSWTINVHAGAWNFLPSGITVVCLPGKDTRQRLPKVRAGPSCRTEATLPPIPSPPSHFEAVQMDPSNGSIQNSSRYRSCRGKFEVITELEGLLTHCCCGDGLRPHRSTKCVSLARDEKRIDVKNTRLETFITLQLGHHVVNSQRTRRAPHNTRPSPEKAEKHSTGTDFS